MAKIKILKGKFVLRNILFISLFRSSACFNAIRLTDISLDGRNGVRMTSEKKNRVKEKRKGEKRRQFFLRLTAILAAIVSREKRVPAGRPPSSSTGYYFYF